MNVLATLGASAVLTAFAASLFAVGASVYGHRAGRPAALLAGRRALLATALLATFAIGTLAYALLVNDFSVAHVASVSSRDMEPQMKWAALYSGQPGSLLFWTWSMSLFMAAFVAVTVPKIPWGGAHAVATCGVVLASFLFALAFLASPFDVSPVTPDDGIGLNPLLVDPGMLVHPPFLLTGLVSTSIPFVLGAAALMAGKVDGAWIRHARSWALLSFLVLGVGNLLGAWWAYTVLGWGGYWGWDPVENSAILPLFPMTAFLHALLVQERRGMLKLWNLVLVLAAFALAVFGTFNVRSGLVASVHSFAQSEVGPYFLVLLGLVIAASVGLLAWRSPILRADADLDSLASRESGLIVNSYILVAITLVVLGGTLFPVFSELFQDVRITVGPPFFNQVVGPLLIALLATLAVGTVLPWRQAATSTLVRRLRGPAVLLLATWVLFAALGMRDPFALATVGLAAVIGFVTLREFAIGARGLRRATGAGWPAATARLFSRDQRRYGGYLVHVGVAVIAVAVVVSTVYQETARVSLAPGESVEAGGYTFTYERLLQRSPGVNGIETEVLAEVTVTRDGRQVGTLEPGRRFFENFPSQPTGIVALDGSLTRDLYLFIQGWDSNEVVELQVFINPLIAWLWIGGAIFVVGGIVAFWPQAQPARVTAEAPEGAQRA
ncbi:MAG: heme lyase CcmF/NrfE family subunit [Dehalococcoidia bacterium]|nr:heme lyase CcmF/NrfE family subunit [Dehalococcoidia bacterium]